MHHTILVVDDDKDNLKFIKSLLESKGLAVHQAPNAQFAASLIHKNIGRYSLAIVDYHMPQIMGDEATKIFQEIDRDLQVITISGDDSNEAFEKNLKAGSYLFLNRDIHPERLISIVESYCKKFEDKKQIFSPKLTKSNAEEFISSFSMVGASKHLVEICEQIDRYSKSDNAVLILGENGTGKERVARSIHEKSLSPKAPFVSVNCGAISENLIESELFGHERGSFTGAIKDRLGLFREANGGTIFLDEVGDMPTSLQVKLLRVLQEREITPVGGTSPVKVNVRVIAATNVNLEKAIKRGSFREDLFYRLNVLPIELKPLRTRTEDIEPLLQHFIEKWKNKTGETKVFRSEVVQALKSYPWPGNVRQLENIVSRLLVRVDGATVEYGHLLDNLKNASEKSETINLLESYQGLRAEFQHKERVILSEIVKQAGSLSKAAKVLQIAKSSLSDKLKTLGVQVNNILTEDHV